VRGARFGEHCSSGMWGTARAAQQLFSSVGKNSYYGAKLQGTLAHRSSKPYPGISRTYFLSNKTIGRPIFSHQISREYPFQVVWLIDEK
jgi:hypothetical protein